MRLMILGNSGSGKSTLAARLGRALDCPVHDLDALHWHADGRRRDAAEARLLVAAAAQESGWIIEGVYGWLADIALERATGLVWLDLPWSACAAGLQQRGLRRGMTRKDHDALIGWARAYWTRETPSSFAGHARLYSAFEGPKWRLLTRCAASAFAIARG